MNLEHVAIWTRQLEVLKEYYVRHFAAKANEKYVNEKNNFESYFLTFESGARLEIMSKPDVPENLNDTVKEQYLGIIHLAFGVTSKSDVDLKRDELLGAGYAILRGPRKTGDGYYEFETLDPDRNRLEVTTPWQD